jgi:poly(hydroxyalkanoate) depolymerase family esterase
MRFQSTLPGIGNKVAGWRKLIQNLERRRGAPDGPVSTRLREVHAFGSNPGNLRMFSYLPPKLAEKPALVVVLHGCTQTASGYDLGAGWSTLADRYGFALLFPEQQRINNPNGCFNWFQPEDSQRDRGEPFSIRQMIEKSIVDHAIDRRRIFVTGLSAGGAMSSIMLACYPEIFAGGAIIAGLPYGAAANVQQAFESMFQSPSRPAREWGNLVRKASSHRGPWPRVSVWHGNVDKTVIPSNAREILKQWIDIHGLSTAPSAQIRVAGYPRDVWMNEASEEILESYTITNMAHGTPLAIGEFEGACGAAGPFLLPVGISSSYHISKFFGIADAHYRQRTPADAESLIVNLPPAEIGHQERAGPALEGEVLDKEDDSKSHQEPKPTFPEIGAVIHKALRAAGLIRS